MLECQCKSACQVLLRLGVLAGNRLRWVPYWEAWVTWCLQVVMQYSNAQVVWCQEEPKNMGAWRYMKPRMDTAMRELMKSREGSMPPSRIRYVGRPAAASPGLRSSPLLTAVKICVLLMHAELFKFGNLHKATCIRLEALWVPA